jgi:ubiquinone/menaquinone biosynthesis C-methylase UbiE
MKKNKYKDWEEIYSEESIRNKNEYPSEDVVSFMMQQYGLIDDMSAINVLELGCGWGNNLRFLRDKKFSYIGVDISETAVNNCKLNNLSAEQCDFKELIFSDCSFDVVIDRQAIQHNSFTDVKSTIEEVYRVLKDGGSFYSIFISKADYYIKTTYLNELELTDLMCNFEIISIDKNIRTLNNQEEKIEYFLVHAKKTNR